MNMNKYLEKHSIIAAVKDEETLDLVFRSEIKIVFLLFGKICEMAALTEKLKKSGKDVYIYIDLIDGLRADKEGLRFIANDIQPRGIISTKNILIRQANDLGLRSVLRIFMIDSSAYSTGLKSIKSSTPTFVEIMPGLVFDVIYQLHQDIDIPIIAGGMIKTEVQVQQAYQNGATAVSTSRFNFLSNLQRQQ